MDLLGNYNLPIIELKCHWRSQFRWPCYEFLIIFWRLNASSYQILFCNFHCIWRWFGHNAFRNIILVGTFLAFFLENFTHDFLGNINVFSSHMPRQNFSKVFVPFKITIFTLTFVVVAINKVFVYRISQLIHKLVWQIFYHFQQYAKLLKRKTMAILKL